jgi:hypothetical protein
MRWTEGAQVRAEWRAVLNTVMYQSINGGKFLDQLHNYKYLNKDLASQR